MDKQEPNSNEGSSQLKPALQRARETKAHLIMASEARAMFMVRVRIKGIANGQYLFFKTEEEFDKWGLGEKGDSYDGHIVYDVKRAMSNLKAAVGDTDDLPQVTPAPPSTPPQKSSVNISSLLPKSSLTQPRRTDLQK